jgi:hypothetical protein
MLSDPPDKLVQKRSKQSVAHRFKIFEPTTIIRQNGIEQRAHLIDISLTGAFVYSRPRPALEERIIVAIGTIAINATVKRLDEDRFGIHFSRTLDAATIKSFPR